MPPRAATHSRPPCTSEGSARVVLEQDQAMEIVLFHIRTREGVDQLEYGRAYERMVELVRQIPGFVRVEEFAGEDGSELAVARFEDTDAIDAWREQPEHVQTRQRGREEFFASYEITIATVHKQYGWSRDG